MDLITNMKQSVITDFDNMLYNMNVGYPSDSDLILNKIAFIQTAYLYTNPMPIYDYLINKKIYRVDGNTQ
jgi:hypothetical protein